MGFGNYIADGTYTVVDNISYSKNNKYITWQLQIFDNSNKDNLLAIRDMAARSSSPMQRIVSTLNTPPPVDQRSIDDIWLIGDEPDGDWQDREDCLAKWTKKGWEFWSINFGQQFYHIELQKYIIYTIDRTFLPYECWDDYWAWQQWFAPQVILESNMYKQIYLYLKNTKAAFSQCLEV